jgi:acetylornithine deacetylase/succinyl-diaminopimelate desuccinylase-like protein
MNQKFDMTVTLSPEQVKEAIAEYVQKELDSLHVPPHDIKLNVEMEYEDRPCSTPYPVFKSAEITVKKAGSYQDR